MTAGSTIYWAVNGPPSYAGSFRGQVVRHDSDGNPASVLCTTDMSKNLRTYQEALADVEEWLRKNNCHAIKG